MALYCCLNEGQNVGDRSRRHHATIMTLHWWMHWFWVTMLLIVIASTGRNLAAPQSEELPHYADFEIEPHVAERQARAMYFTKTPQITNINKTTPTTQRNNTEKDSPKTNTTITNMTLSFTNTTQIQTIKWTPVNITDSNVSIVSLPENATNLNLTIDFTNVTESQNSTFTKKRNLTTPDFVKEDLTLEGASESRIVTEKPLSLETAFLQTRIPPNIESSRRIIDSGDGGMDTGAIAGISFAALVLAALAGSTAFVLYRRRYLNKPQTLNDKCSNPDSSGYLDDSTIRVCYI
ncbi:jg13570 [Pararge aegeria aegeria]|uniref:Jg13570 protein n=1 Tax=Pararge aegeria aegeria TaxID=348720 RepID=A0A8S4QTC9_9NEOP|nr:jg13570 [Pararge aegeria aegeria]